MGAEESDGGMQDGSGAVAVGRSRRRKKQGGSSAAAAAAASGRRAGSVPASGGGGGSGVESGANRLGLDPWSCVAAAVLLQEMAAAGADGGAG